MNAPRLLARRSNTVCLSCRRNLAATRQFSSSPAPFAAAFQSYTLPSQPPAAPRNASVPDTSITRPIQSPPLPTRPPKQPTATSPFSVPEQEAQQSKTSFASSTTTSASPSSQQPPAASPASSSAAKTATPTPAAPKPRASKLRTPRKAAMKLTPSAVERLREMLDQPDPKLVKVGVKNRGCSGLAYHLEYVDKPGAFDESVEQDGVKVLIDSKALFSIIGSEMDWVEDKLSQRFVFRNPNIKEQCGCGESFMV
ncbi:iron-sulfur assembly protein 1 [Naviculisporaceae sp. PSN 640]